MKDTRPLAAIPIALLAGPCLLLGTCRSVEPSRPPGRAALLQTITDPNIPVRVRQKAWQSMRKLYPDIIPHHQLKDPPGAASQRTPGRRTRAPDHPA